MGNEFIVNKWLKADRLVNTIPLRDFVYMLIPEPPSEVLKATTRLDYNSLVVVGIGLKQKAPPHHWVYVPDKHVIFHRYAWISNYGEDTPSDHSTLIAEVTVSPNTVIDLEKIKNRVVEDLTNLNIINEKAIEVVKTWFHKYAYPIYSLTHDEDVAIIERYLAELGIITFGRWGNWHYWNTDKIYEKSENLTMI